MLQRKEITEEPISNDPFIREDISDIFVASIDPKGSKDLDDAISITKDSCNKLLVNPNTETYTFEIEE